MPVELDSSIDIRQAFTAAYLLTGDITFAEWTVLQAIDSSSGDAANLDFLRRVIDSSLRYMRGLTHGSIRKGADVWTELPHELRNVLELNVLSRSCFVLRLLLQMPLDICAVMLQLQPSAVSELTGLAARELVEKARPHLRQSSLPGRSARYAQTAQEIS
jgi:hypothetical protein